MKKRLKICIYAISKNEEKHAERWAKSCVSADGLYVLDTGSTDKTIEILNRFGVVAEQRIFTPWRFDVARNAAMSMLPMDTDIAIVLDLDEVLCKDWRKIVEEAWNSGERITEIRHLYAFSPDMCFQNSRVHSRHNYEWINAIHEVQVHTKRKANPVFIKDVLIEHYQDTGKSRKQYLDLLKISVQENPLDSRNSFYYGRELTYYNRWEEAKTELMRYLSLPGSKWDKERAYACGLLAKCASALGLKSVESLLLRACSEDPNMREAWFHLGEYYRQKEMFSQGYACAIRGLQIAVKPNTFLDEKDVWTYAVHDLAAVCGYYLGLKAEALEHAAAALRASPGDSRLKENLDIIELECVK